MGPSYAPPFLRGSWQDSFPRLIFVVALIARAYAGYARGLSLAVGGIGAGWVPITTFSAGDAAFNAMTIVSQTFSISPAAITEATIASRTYSGGVQLPNTAAGTVPAGETDTVPSQTKAA